MDGGLADNLSLRNLLDGVTIYGGWEVVLDRVRKRGITKLAIIVVNAAVESQQDLARFEEKPGYSSVSKAIINSSIDRKTKETVALVEGSLALWQAQRPARRTGADNQPKVYFIHVDFHSSADPAERAYFDSIPTTLHLPAETIDRLIAGGGKLLRESPAYRDLLQDLALGQPARTDHTPPAFSP
jgi:NTE family protein